MSGFLGTPGALAELQYRGGLSTKTDRPVSFTRTLGGKRKAMVGPRGRREWDVSFDLIASRDTAGLVEIARSAGEVMWYPADAVAGNLLSPQASGWEPTPGNGTDAGLVQLPDGTVARSLSHSGAFDSPVNVGSSAGIYEPIPVKPGTPLSLGAWGFGGVGITGAWRDAVGANIGNETPGGFTFAGWQWRQVTLTPPAGAVGFHMLLTQGTQYARPAASWGSKAMDRPGRGCPKAVVHGLAEALTTITDDAHGSISVTITEVG